MKDRPTKKAKKLPSTKGQSIVKPQTTPRITSSNKPSTKKIANTPEEKESVQDSPKGKGKEPTLTKVKKSKGKAREENVLLPTSFKVVAGSYEKLLYGLDGTVVVGDDSKLKVDLKPCFIFPAHVSCIKAVAASPHGGKWLATGSADEIIKVWDLRRRKEIGGLMHHEGDKPGLFFTCTTDLICIYRVNNTFIIPLPLTSSISIRGWNTVLIPCS